MRAPLPPSFRAGVCRTALGLLPAFSLLGAGACAALVHGGAQAAGGPPLVRPSGCTRAAVDQGLAQALKSPAAPVASAAEPDPRHLFGTWALSDCRNRLFNLLVRPDGTAVAVLGGPGIRTGLGDPLSADALMELGRWRPWGNGLRVDYGNGWTDSILVGPGGIVQWSWEPGRDRRAPPTNNAKALQLTAPESGWVGVYRLVPTQAEKPPYLASLLSSGVAYNTIDRTPGGSWWLERDHLVIAWASGWRTTLELAEPPRPGQSFRVRHWAPGRDLTGTPSAERSGSRL